VLGFIKTGNNTSPRCRILQESFSPLVQSLLKNYNPKNAWAGLYPRNRPESRGSPGKGRLPSISQATVTFKAIRASREEFERMTRYMYLYSISPWASRTRPTPYEAQAPE